MKRPVSLPPSSEGKSPLIDAPVWNIRLAWTFDFGKNEARLPLYMNVGACHLIVSVMRLSALSMISRTACTTGFIGLSYFAIHASTSLGIRSSLTPPPPHPIVAVVEARMAKVRICDDAIWLKHIEGDPRLEDR